MGGCGEVVESVVAASCVGGSEMAAIAGFWTGVLAAMAGFWSVVLAAMVEFGMGVLAAMADCWVSSGELVRGGREVVVRGRWGIVMGGRCSARSGAESSVGGADRACCWNGNVDTSNTTWREMMTRPVARFRHR